MRERSNPFCFQHCCKGVLKYIRDELHETFPTKMDFWCKVKGINSKTAALIVYCLTGESVACPVDVHVQEFSIALGHTNGTTPDEICWQLQELKLVHPNEGVEWNDACGSICQQHRDGKLARLVEKAKDNENAKSNWPDLEELMTKLFPDLKEGKG